MLTLALVMRGLALDIDKYVIAAAGASILGGLIFRKQRRAAFVVFVWFAVTTFASLILLGILFPLVGLMLAGGSEWLWPAAGLATVILITLTGVRTRVALMRDFSKSLEGAPGVFVGSEGVFRHELVPQDNPSFGWLAWAALVSTVGALVFSHGTTHHLTVVLGICPGIAALFCVDPVARVLALFIAVLQWERAHGKRLYLASL
jgi:hypothetical protein